MTLRTGASIAVLAFVLGLTPAAAQTTQQTQQKPSATTEAPKTPVSGQIMAQDVNTVLAKDFLGLAVYSPDKLKIGNINDLIMSKDAKSVEGFVIGVGGFLGIGEKNVALKIDRLQISNTPEGAVLLTMDAKKEELTNAPSFKSKRDMDLEKQAADRTRNAPCKSIHQQLVHSPTTSWAGANCAGLFSFVKECARTVCSRRDHLRLFLATCRAGTLSDNKVTCLCTSRRTT